MEFDARSSPELPSTIGSSHQPSRINFVDAAPKKELSVDEHASRDYMRQCCKSRCSWLIALDECIKAHIFFSHLSQAESRNWLKERILASSTSTNGRRECNLIFVDRHVCNQAFKLLYGISNNKFSQALHDCQFPHTLPVHGNTGRTNRANISAQQHIFNWISEFIDSCGDRDPASDHIHFPCYISQHGMYSMYKHDCATHLVALRSIPSQTAFNKVMDSRFPNIRFLKKTRLGRCDFCLSIPLRRQQITSQADREAFREACRLHHQLHTGERLAYTNHKHVAKQSPDRIMSMVVDCPDSYDLPSVVPVTKETGSLPKVEFSAVGTISHHSRTRSYYWYLPSFVKNTNLILTVLYLELLSQFVLMNHHPSILWLQLDNASGENKNQWMLAFLSWLIHLGWFTEIMVSMMMPGHTHIDIDQMFSTLAIYADKHSVDFMGTIAEAIAKAYKSKKTKPSSHILGTVFNWMGFLAPHTQQLSGTKSPHVFLLRKLSDGQIGLKVCTFF